MESDANTLDNGQLKEAAIGLALERCWDTFSGPELASIRLVFPYCDSLVDRASFYEPTVPELRRAAAKGLWPGLKEASLHPHRDDDNADVLEAFASMSLPNLEILDIHNFGRTDPAREAAALATARWPQLRHLTIFIASDRPWETQVDPGEEWTAAMASLSTAGLPITYLVLKSNNYDIDNPVDFPLADIARCFSTTLSRLMMDYHVGENAATALAMDPLLAPLARVDLINYADRLISALAASQTQWPSITTFAAENCRIRGEIDGLGTALPALQDLWLSFVYCQATTAWNNFVHLLRSLEGIPVRKIVIKWSPVGVLRAAAGVRLHALKVLSIRYVHSFVDENPRAAEEGMNALLRADLMALEKLAVSFEASTKTGVYPRWLDTDHHHPLPERPWPVLKSFALEGIRVSENVARFLELTVLHRVPTVRIVQPSYE